MPLKYYTVYHATNLIRMHTISRKMDLNFMPDIFLHACRAAYKIVLLHKNYLYNIHVATTVYALLLE